MAESFVSGTDRQNQIVHLLEQHQRISVAELCAFFSISEATARRDLEALALEGKIQRVHGGALLLPKAPPELPVLERSHEQEQEKQRIGRVAAGLVHLAVHGANRTFRSNAHICIQHGRIVRMSQNGRKGVEKSLWSFLQLDGFHYVAIFGLFRGVHRRGILLSAISIVGRPPRAG